MKTPAYRYKGKLVRVRDGDTAIIEIDLGFDCSIRLPLRIADVNTPERGEEGYEKARHFLGVLLSYAPDKTLIVETRKLKAGGDARTFERYVADLWVNGQPVAKALVEAGHAKVV